MLSIKTIKVWCLIHKWTSLLCTVFLLLLCLTGLLLIFHHEIDHLLGDAVEPPALPADTPRASLDRIVETATARRPSEFVQFVSQPADEPDAQCQHPGDKPEGVGPQVGQAEKDPHDSSDHRSIELDFLQIIHGHPLEHIDQFPGRVSFDARLGDAL
ncbi:MAG: PepSY domain-containing protein [Firmicutes bacterium]|nr:PepSY domain-containing protein [Bacillota bacterium]